MTAPSATGRVRMMPSFRAVGVEAAPAGRPAGDRGPGRAGRPAELRRNTWSDLRCRAGRLRQDDTAGAVGRELATAGRLGLGRPPRQ